MGMYNDWRGGIGSDLVERMLTNAKERVQNQNIKLDAVIINGDNVYHGF